MVLEPQSLDLSSVTLGGSVRRLVGRSAGSASGGAVSESQECSASAGAARPPGLPLLVGRGPLCLGFYFLAETLQAGSRFPQGSNLYPLGWKLWTTRQVPTLSLGQLATGWDPGVPQGPAFPSALSLVPSVFLHPLGTLCPLTHTHLSHAFSVLGTDRPCLFGGYGVNVE